MQKKVREKAMRIAALFALFVLCFGMLWGGRLFAPLAYAESNRPLEFDETNVLDDLAGATVDGKPFNLLNYPFYPSAEPEMHIVGVIEYCYSYFANANGNYGLYLYVYNPNGQDIDTDSTANTALMATAYDTYPITQESKPTAYEKFALKFCSTIESGAYKHLFYKFRVVDHESADGKTIRDRVNSNGRRYDISGIELQNTDGTIHDYGVGGSYLFSGYTKGYGIDENAESDLTCKVNELETVELQTTSTFYRTGEYKTNYQHDLTSVYFAVPDRFFDDYGGLQKVKADWHEYVTTPIAITSNTEVYNELSPWIGKSIGKFNNDVPLSLYTGYQEVSGSNGHYATYDWVYNALPDSPASSLLANAVFLIRSNFHHEYFHTEQLCQMLGVSRSTLYRAFQSELNISPGEFLSNFRIHQACRLLELGNSVKTAAVSCGFSDAFYFSRAFHRRMGVSPSDYRRQPQKQDAGSEYSRLVF